MDGGRLLDDSSARVRGEKGSAESTRWLFVLLKTDNGLCSLCVYEFNSVQRAQNFALLHLLLEDALGRDDENHHDQGDDDSKAAAAEEEERVVVAGGLRGLRRDLDHGRGELNPPAMLVQWQGRTFQGKRCLCRSKGPRCSMQRRGRTRCAAPTVHAALQAPSNARPRAQCTWEPALILRPTAAAGLADEVARRARWPTGIAEGEKASEERRRQRPANRKRGDEIRNGGSMIFSVGSTRVVARARHARGRQQGVWLIARAG